MSQKSSEESLLYPNGPVNIVWSYILKSGENVLFRQITVTQDLLILNVNYD